MSRSRKKAIVKDKPKREKRTPLYWRPVRRIWKQQVAQFHNQLWRGRFGYWEFDDTLPNNKSLINDYDYCDYITDHEHDYHITNWWTREDRKKQRILLRRK